MTESNGHQHTNPHPTESPSPVMARPAAPPPAPSPTRIPTARTWHPLRSLHPRHAALDLALIMLITILIPFGFEWLVAAYTNEKPDFDIIWLLVAQKWFDASLVVGLLTYLIFRHRLPARDFGLTTARLGPQTAWGILTLIAVYATLAITVVIIGIIITVNPEFAPDIEQRTEFIGRLPVRDPWLSTLLLIPVVIHEEVIFRALLLPYLHRLTGKWWLAIAVSSALFAVLHIAQGGFAVMQILFVATVLAVFFLFSRSLWAVTLAHFCFNFLQFQLINLYEQIGIFTTSQPATPA